MSRRFIVYFAVILITLIGGFVYADSNRYVRVSYVEGDVSLYSSDGQRPSDLQRNAPVLDGDEIEVKNGRVELAFRNGIIVRLGDYSSMRIQSTYSPMQLELLTGNLYVDSRMVDNLREELEVRAADAQIYLIDEGNMRVDIGSEGTVRVSATQGETEVRANGGRVLLQQGERTYIDPGNAPESAEVFDRDYDEFDDWNESRMDAELNSYNDSKDDGYVDDSIAYDAYDLHDYGDWRAYGSFGNVWVPHVGYGWRPYNDGRWMYINGGYFWQSYEPWGWTPYHYGRWGWGLDIGWYWIPGYSFAPSYVSWYDYGDYLGWCPLNYYNRPIIVYNDHHNYPYVQKQRTLDVTNAWTFVPKNRIGDSDIKKIRLEDTKVKGIKLDPTRVVKTPHKEIATYVIPKTTRVPSLVNDKKIVKVPTDDIENPNGLKHRGDEFDRNVKPSERDGSHDPRTAEPVRKPTKGNPIVKDSDQGDRNRFQDDSLDRDKVQRNPNSRDLKIRSREPDYDRDQQFKIGKREFEENQNGRKPLGPYVSPYYRDRQSDRTDRDQQFREGPSSRDPDAYKNDNDREVSPKYLDEAKKIFERLQNNRENYDRRGSYDNSKRVEPRNDKSGQRQPEVKKSQPPPQRNQPAPKSRTEQRKVKTHN
jgi:hypothetical protein